MNMTHSNDQWNECPPGALKRLGQELNASHRSKQLQKNMGRAGLACLLLAVGFVGYRGAQLAADPAANTPYGGITCEECQGHFIAYRDHLVDQSAIEPAVAQSMEVHLEKCVLCRFDFKQKFPGVLAAAAVPIGLSLATMFGLAVWSDPDRRSEAERD